MEKQPNNKQQKPISSKKKTSKKPKMPAKALPKPRSQRVNRKPKSANIKINRINLIQSHLKNEPIIRPTKQTDLKAIAQKITSLSLIAKSENLVRSEMKGEIPIVVSVKTEDVETEEFRSGLDLIMLVDVSGSMCGEKIKLVKDTILFIIDELTQFDRLGIIAFNSSVSTLSGLIPMTDSNKTKLRSIVANNLNASGSTNIAAAITSTYNFLANRTDSNESTAVFLLSDGDDTCGNNYASIAAHLNSGHARMKTRKMSYSMHSFGYGSGHDEKILSLISDTTGGNFYFIKQLSYIDECFIDCFGLLLSVFGRGTKVEVHLAPGVKFTRTDSEGFEKKTDRAALIEVGDIATGQEYTYLGFVSFDSNKIDLSKQSLRFGDAELEFKCQGKNIFKSLEIEFKIVDKADERGDPNPLVSEEVEKSEAKRVMEEAREELKKGKVIESKAILATYSNRMQASSSLGIQFKSKMAKNLSFTNIQNDKDYVQVHRKMRKKKEINPEYANFRSSNKVQKKMKQRKKARDNDLFGI